MLGDSSLKNLSVKPIYMVFDVTAQYFKLFVTKPYLGVIAPLPRSSIPAAPEFAVTAMPLHDSR